MDTTNSQNKKPRVGIGTIGHPGHGKTTLTQAITNYLPKTKKEDFEKLKWPWDKEEHVSGTMIQKWVEEKEKIFDPPWYEYETKYRLYEHTDWPEDPTSYVNKLVTRERQLNGAILVVAASEGVMPQTRQHLFLAQHIGVSKLVVFMNKMDLVDDAQDMARVEREIRVLLNQYQFDGAQTPIIQGSALQALHGESKAIEVIATLLTVIDQYISIPLRLEEKPFLMPIDSFFPITMRGVPVICGRILQGVINAGDSFEINDVTKGGKKSFNTVVQGVEIFRRILDRGEAGDSVSLLLGDVDQDAIHAGMIACQPDSLSSGKVFICEVYVNEGNHQTALSNGGILEFRSCTDSVLGLIKAPQKIGMVPTGSIVRFEVTLDTAIPMDIGLFIEIWEEENRLLGLGKVIQILDSDDPH